MTAPGIRPQSEGGKKWLADKLVALDPHKAELCHLLCRALSARRVVEAGTSYGVSTIYLAAAVRDTIAASGGEGEVIGAEHEPGKAAAARENLAEAGLADYVDVREGDLRSRWHCPRWNWWRQGAVPGRWWCATTSQRPQAVRGLPRLCPRSRGPFHIGHRAGPWRHGDLHEDYATGARQATVRSPEKNRRISAAIRGVLGIPAASIRLPQWRDT
ncbi:class I SAM-dependent methyltransferase [Actinophytocola oryzae]|uniref:O-methyltransferase n=1 Tax=Actinophytocola oryzae TaxID=502181 RepID=UPI0010641F5A